MLAEPHRAPDVAGQKENSGREVAALDSAVQDAGRPRMAGAGKMTNAFQRGPRRGRRQCENRGRRPRGRRKARRGRGGQVVEAVTLFEVVSVGSDAIQSVVDDWVRAYKADRDGALLDLINFFIQCSGCQGLVTAEMFQSSPKNDLSRKMAEEFDEETGLQYKKFMAYPWILTVTWPVDMENDSYPLIRPGPYWKKFRANFCEFTAVLIQQCQAGILYDGYLMDTVISLLTGLTESMVRALRHTSTLAAMKLLTALVDVILKLDVSQRNAQRLYEVEKKRVTGRKAGYPLDELDRRKKELERKPVEIENMVNALFRGTFLWRYRDVIPEIRAICVEEMGSWLRMHPAMFLNDSYLKYVGWMLYDKPEVRLKCLLGLKGLYDRKDLAFKMDLFSSRFKERIVSMTLDKDGEVAVEAVKLLMLMSRNCEDALSPADRDALCRLVYAVHRPLAVAAGEFLHKRLLDSGSSQEECLSGKRGKFGCRVSRLKRLLAFFLEGEMQSHVTYLVDSLWDWAADLLKDWECMTALLLGDLGEEEEALSPAQETALVEMVAVTVRQAAEGHPPGGRAAARKVLSAKEKKVQLEDCTRMTTHFSATLPRLLDKFSADAGKVADLLQVLRYFDRDAYANGDAGKHGSELTEQVKGLVLRHREPGVLEACAVAFAVLCGHEPTRPGGAALARSRLTDQLAAHLARLLEDFFREGEGLRADEEGVAQISATLQRISAFYSTLDLSGRSVSGKTERLLAAGAEHGSLPVQIALPALQCSYYSLLWQLASASDGQLSGDDTVELKNRVKCFCQVCGSYLSHPERDLSEKAFVLLCDLLFASSHRGPGDEAGFGLSFLPPAPELQSAILGFVRDRVFVEEEDDGTSGPAEEAAEGQKMEEEEKKRKERERKLTALPRRRSLLAVYCKLIASDVVDGSSAAEVFGHYVKAYDDFGDIIKETLSRTRHNSQVGTARTLILCLKKSFQKHLEARDPSLAHVRELARRFSLTFGWDQVKSREAVTTIHKEGIEFAFHGFPGAEGNPHPPNLSFLMVVGEFSSKLLRPDRRLVYGYLQRFIPEHKGLERGEGWQPLACYRNSLLSGQDEDGAGVAGVCSPLGRPKASSSLKRKEPGASREWTPVVSGSPSGGDSAPANARKRLRFPDKGAADGPAGLSRKSRAEAFPFPSAGAPEVISEEVDVLGTDQEPCVSPNVSPVAPREVPG
ncbi:cohesin subunit SA-2-like isoform X2 [Tachyglossus aculeatus]|uniref:cohesin subunit SA-2-like isoform X2 n=1 Tax=Tachyglossus aculeatus TaxID=9261 RepID=UPI0018F73F27|nr:cohesin subunit SA-2-like isoform X2 [Tachyglossus aculeatus]